MATSQSLKAQLSLITVDSDDDAGQLFYKFAEDGIKDMECLEQSPDNYTRTITVENIAKGVRRALNFLKYRTLDY